MIYRNISHHSIMECLKWSNLIGQNTSRDTNVAVKLIIALQIKHSSLLLFCIATQHYRFGISDELAILQLKLKSVVNHTLKVNECGWSCSKYNAKS